jgi:hypothetical protein
VVKVFAFLAANTATIKKAHSDALGQLPDAVIVAGHRWLLRPPSPPRWPPSSPHVSKQ